MADSQDAEDDEEFGEQGSDDRLWLIQCKRERAIGPTKIKGYLDEISLQAGERLHGVIFAAACDFSKKTRDIMLEWCRNHGIAEAHVWGRGELEDMLYQPKNDNLLFAYFGISLTIRRRSVATQLRSELAIKRKLQKTVVTSSAEILVRDPLATEYPYAEPGKQPTLWRVYSPEELTHQGLMVRYRRYYAYFDPTTKEWDAADQVDSMRLHHPWQVRNEKDEELESIARDSWDKFPDGRRGWLKLSAFIPLRNLVAIDEMGDDVFKGTHVYATFHPRHGPLDGKGCWIRLATTSPYEGEFRPELSKRVVRFPESVRRINHEDF